MGRGPITGFPETQAVSRWVYASPAPVRADSDGGAGGGQRTRREQRGPSRSSARWTSGAADRPITHLRRPSADR